MRGTLVHAEEGGRWWIHVKIGKDIPYSKDGDTSWHIQYWRDGTLKDTYTEKGDTGTQEGWGHRWLHT